MCEEVRHPATQVPKAMVGTIVLNTICGLFFLIPLVFVMPDQAYLAGLLSGQPTPAIIADAVGSSGGAIGLLLPLMVLGLFCGIGCTTASSRAIYAFARDGGIPGYKLWRIVNTKYDVPVNAMMLSMGIQLILGLIYFGAAAAFNAFSGVGVICLTLSYAAPIVCSVLGGRKQMVEGQFYLGKLGLFCNIVAIGMSTLCAYCLFIANDHGSLVCPCNSSLLHADLPPCYPCLDELRLRCSCRRYRCLYHLVLRLGQGQLRGSPHTRGCRARGKKGQLRQHTQQISDVYAQALRRIVYRPALFFMLERSSYMIL